MLIIRGQVKIWKPQVTQMSDLKPGQLNMSQEDPAANYIQKTSLAADKQVQRNPNIDNVYQQLIMHNFNMPLTFTANQ